MNAPTTAARRIEEAAALDGWPARVQDTVRRALRPGAVRNTLSGVPLGHPAHPMLVSMPIGAWGMSALCDAAGRRGAGPAAGLIAAGLAAALPTAATGLNDWADTIGPARRVGAVHGAANNAGALLMAASLAARLRGRRGVGRALSWTALGFVGAGGYLGGHLTYVRGTNVNHAAWEAMPREWTRIADAGDVPEEGATHADCEGSPVLLSRDGTGVRAVSAVCTHMGGPLHQGRIEDGCVTCPLHGSVFRLDDGAVVRGPASVPQPVYEARIHDGGVQVRAARVAR